MIQLASGYSIARSTPEDLAALRDVERAASTLFEGWDLSPQVLADSTSLEDFRVAHDEGLLWVAQAERAGPVGFAFVEMVGDAPHLDELDVHPDHGRRGLGRALVETVIEWARDAGHRQLTLTTFIDVPWNAPFYAALGFSVLEPEAYSGEIAELVREEAQRGLDPSERVVMRYAIWEKSASLNLASLSTHHGGAWDMRVLMSQ